MSRVLTRHDMKGQGFVEHYVQQGLPQQDTSTKTACRIARQRIAWRCAMSRFKLCLHYMLVRGALRVPIHAGAELVLQSTLEPLLHFLRSKVAGRTQ